MCFAMKYCPISTVVRNPASVQHLITRFCSSSFEVPLKPFLAGRKPLCRSKRRPTRFVCRLVGWELRRPSETCFQTQMHVLTSKAQSLYLETTCACPCDFLPFVKTPQGITSSLESSNPGCALVNSPLVSRKNNLLSGDPLFLCILEDLFIAFSIFFNERGVSRQRPFFRRWKSSFFFVLFVRARGFSLLPVIQVLLDREGDAHSMSATQSACKLCFWTPCSR